MPETPHAQMTPLPYLTAEIRGVGGVIKVEPEDFVVEELPLYEPSGQGEHLFLWVEKRGWAAEELTAHIAKSLGIARSEVGAAGLKDRRAVTRQTVSVPARCEEHVAAIDAEAIKVLRAGRHGNKLKTGHLKGNRFDVLVRNVGDDAEERAHHIAQAIAAHGFPNYFGEQRFGHEGETLSLGLDLLAQRKAAHEIAPSRRRFLLRLALSAVQSAVFNEVLNRRIRDGLLGRVLLGDVMQVRSSGGPFVVEDAAREQQRFERGETVISGPIFGLKMRHPSGEAAERERSALGAFGLSREHFAHWRKLLPGTRRPLLAMPEQLQVNADRGGLRFRFELARGVYATALLREFMKNDRPQTKPATPTADAS